jgi:membrane protein DedA with SNARE-associated domain
MDRSTFLWTMVAFFGAAIAFNGIQQITEDESTLVTLLAQIVVLGLIIAFIVFMVRRSERGDRKP